MTLAEAVKALRHNDDFKVVLENLSKREGSLNQRFSPT